jgi:hypothetical protein
VGTVHGMSRFAARCAPALGTCALALGLGLAMAPASCKPRPPEVVTLAEVDGEVFDAAADATHVYFLVWKNPRAQIARMPLAGGPIEKLGDDDESPRFIALTSDAVYWTTEQNAKRLPKSGGKPALFAANVVGPIAIDDSELYSLESKPSGQHRLVARALAGDAKRVVQEEAHGAAFIAVDDKAVYVSRSTGGGKVERLPKKGDPPSVLAQTRVGGPLLLAGSDVYFCDQALFRVSKEGGVPVQINGTCGERLVSLSGVVYGSRESTSNGLGGHQNGSVTALVDGSRDRLLFEGSSARGMIAAGGSIYVAARSDKLPRTTWLRVRVAPQ